MSSPKPRNCYHKLQGQYRIAASSYIPETTFVFVGPDKFPSGNVRARIYAVEKREEDLPFTLGDPDGDGCGFRHRRRAGVRMGQDFGAIPRRT